MSDERKNRGYLEKVYPLQTYLYMLLKSIDLKTQEEPLTREQEAIITEHLEYALVAGYERALRSLPSSKKKEKE